MADQQLIEIAKALSVDARVLILDEPTASLSAHESGPVFAASSVRLVTAAWPFSS